MTAITDDWDDAASEYEKATEPEAPVTMPPAKKEPVTEPPKPDAPKIPALIPDARAAKIRAWLEAHPEVAAELERETLQTADELQRIRSHVLNAVLELKEVALLVKEGRMRTAPDPVQLYICPICPELFESVEKVRKHVEEKHPMLIPEVPAGAR